MENFGIRKSNDLQSSRNVNKTHRSNIFVEEPSAKSFDGLKLVSEHHVGSSSFFGVHQDDGKKNLAKQESGQCRSPYQSSPILPRQNDAKKIGGASRSAFGDSDDNPLAPALDDRRPVKRNAPGQTRQHTVSKERGDSFKTQPRRATYTGI